MFGQPAEGEQKDDPAGDGRRVEGIVDVENHECEGCEREREQHVCPRARVEQRDDQRRDDRSRERPDESRDPARKRRREVGAQHDHRGQRDPVAALQREHVREHGRDGEHQGEPEAVLRERGVRRTIRAQRLQRVQRARRQRRRIEAHGFRGVVVRGELGRAPRRAQLPEQGARVVHHVGRDRVLDARHPRLERLPRIVPIVGSLSALKRFGDAAQDRARRFAERNQRLRCPRVAVSFEDVAMGGERRERRADAFGFGEQRFEGRDLAAPGERLGIGEPLAQRFERLRARRAEVCVRKITRIAGERAVCGGQDLPFGRETGNWPDDHEEQRLQSAAGKDHPAHNCRLCRRVVKLTEDRKRDQGLQPDDRRSLAERCEDSGAERPEHRKCGARDDVTPKRSRAKRRERHPGTGQQHYRGFRAIDALPRCESGVECADRRRDGKQ